jgi:hypothetical protein
MRQGGQVPCPRLNTGLDVMTYYIHGKLISFNRGRLISFNRGRMNS